ncbi:MAG: hypothetical protein DI544_03650 [Sphingomonas taxi]|uniref:Uncharacterized protein n=1 Tax=Sphingomonas taxi TaxID=1549858 RepID=A0A2W5P9E5_9SPHN|nr:MAG: hypothetical protein DI544_03650 [Sphingomonas taxi]
MTSAARRIVVIVIVIVAEADCPRKPGTRAHFASRTAPRCTGATAVPALDAHRAVSGFMLAWNSGACRMQIRTARRAHGP